RVEHAGADGRLVGVVGEDVPAAERDVLEAGERDVVADRGGVAVGALANADVAELRERADRLADAAADREHAGDERGRDRAHARQQDPELAGGRLDVDGFLEGHVLSSEEKKAGNCTTASGGTRGKKANWPANPWCRNFTSEMDSVAHRDRRDRRSGRTQRERSKKNGIGIWNPIHSSGPLWAR